MAMPPALAKALAAKSGKKASPGMQAAAQSLVAQKAARLKEDVKDGGKDDASENAYGRKKK